VNARFWSSVSPADPVPQRRQSGRRPNHAAPLQLVVRLQHGRRGEAFFRPSSCRATARRRPGSPRASASAAPYPL
jgi:hypothetical protein